MSTSGTWTGPFGYAGNFGYQQDASGLKLLGHRYYDPSTGRFLTRDPIKDGRNWYAYGAGEAAPTTISDSTGLSTVPLTSSQKGQVMDAIVALAEYGEASEAADLEEMLHTGRIVSDPGLKALAEVRHGTIVLGPAFFGLFNVATGRRVSNQLRRSARLQAASVLLHEWVHLGQWVTAANKPAMERSAYERQLDFIESVLNSSNVELTPLVKRDLGTFAWGISENGKDYGYKPRPRRGF